MKGPRTYSIGVRGKLVLSLLLLVVLSMWLLGLALMQLTRSAFRAQLETRATVIASAVESVFWTEGRPSRRETGLPGPILKSLLQSIAEDPEVLEVTVLDDGGRLIAEAPAGAEQSGGGRDSVDFSFPFSPGPGKTGKIGVRFSLRGLGRQLALSQLRIIVQLAITALVLIVFINILVSLSVLAPIRRLLSATERIGAGDMSRGVEAGGRDEFGALSRSFNTMLERLRASEENNRRQLESLRRAHGELQEKEEQLVRSEKMAAVGRVAAGVAHEVGNPLGSVTGYLAMLRDEKLSPEESREYLDRTGKELGRINRIMVDLLDYARPPQIEWADVDLNVLLRDVGQLLSAQKGFAGVALLTGLQENLPPVRGDFHRLQQLLVNLTLNAAQAISDGGTVTLESFRRPGPGGQVGIRVRDDGPGVRAEDLPHIFDPFFTTRKGGKGSGLGLALCQRIAYSLGASIEVDSKPGEGSTFTVLFPDREKSEEERREDG